MAYTLEFVRADGSTEQFLQTFSRRRDAISFGELSVMEDHFYYSGPPLTDNADPDAIESDQFWRKQMTVDFKVVKLYK